VAFKQRGRKDIAGGGDEQVARITWINADAAVVVAGLAGRRDAVPAFGLQLVDAARLGLVADVT
jgi:hypothetical protein